MPEKPQSEAGKRLMFYAMLGTMHTEAQATPDCADEAAHQRQKRTLEWTRERERLTETFEANDGGDGWPLSPEARTNLRKDIAEVNRTLARLQADDSERTS